MTCHQGQHPKYMMFDITSFLLLYFELVQTVLFLKSFSLYAALEPLCTILINYSFLGSIDSISLWDELIMCIVYHGWK